MRDWLRERLSARPGWMNVLLVFSAYMAFVYVPWDLFVKPVALDEEVWFGVRFHGPLIGLHLRSTNVADLEVLQLGVLVAGHRRLLDLASAASSDSAEVPPNRGSSVA